MTRSELESLAIGKAIMAYVYHDQLFPSGEWLQVDLWKLKNDCNYILMDYKPTDSNIYIDKVRKILSPANPHGDDNYASEMLAA